MTEEEEDDEEEEEVVVAVLEREKAGRNILPSLHSVSEKSTFGDVIGAIIE